MAAPPPVLTVAVEKGPRQGETRQCRAGAALRVGRVVKGNDLAVRDVGASQQHLKIEFLPPPGAGWAVSDLGTSNGTILNGAALVPSVPAPLSHGDLIKVGDSTVLAVSMASDSDPIPVANPSQRRTLRQAAVAVVEEKPPVVNRRGTRNKTAAEAPEVEKEEPDAAAVVVEEKPPVVARRGTRNKAPKAAETPEVGKVEPHAAAAVVAVEERPPAATRRGTRNKVPTASHVPIVEKEEPDAAAVVVEAKPQVARRRGGRKKLAPDEMDETAEAPRQGEQKKASEPFEPENDDGEKEEKASVPTRRGGRKKNVATVAPPPLPPKTRSVRGRGTRATASTTVLQEEQGENELTASRTQAANPWSPTAVKGGQYQKGAGDGGVELDDAAKALNEEMRKGKSSAHRAASDNGANAAAAEPTGETEEEDAEAMPRRMRKKVVEFHESRKDEEKNTVVTHRGGRKKVVEQYQPEKEEGTTMAPRRRGQKKVVEQPETKKDLEETTLVMHCGGQKKVADQLEPDKEDDEKEEGAQVLTRRGGRKEVAEQSEPKDEVTTVVTRRGQRKNVAEQHDTMKDVEETSVVTRRGGRKKVVDQLQPEKNVEETTVVTRRGGQKKVQEQPQPEKEDDEKEVGVPTLTCRGGRKKAVKPPELEMEEEDAVRVTRRKGQKKAAVVTCHAGSKKDPAVVAPPPLPPKTRSGRGRGRVTRTSARNNVLEEDAKAEQVEDEVTVPIEQAGNLQVEMPVNGGEDKEVKVAVSALADDAPEGGDSIQHASSGNGGKENQGGAHCSSRVDSGSNGIPNTTSKYREDTKLKAYSTPFDVRLDRALKKYSA